MYQRKKRWQCDRASSGEPKWPGKSGRYLNVLNRVSLKGLSLETCGGSSGAPSARDDEGGQLLDGRLAGAGGQHGQDVTAGGGGADGLLLARAQLLEPEGLAGEAAEAGRQRLELRGGGRFAQQVVLEAVALLQALLPATVVGLLWVGGTVGDWVEHVVNVEIVDWQITHGQ